MKEIVKEYERWLGILGFNDFTVYEYPLLIKQFFEWLEKAGINQIVQLTANHIRNYHEYLETRPNQRRRGNLSASHLNHHFIAIDKLLEFLHQIGMEEAPQPSNYRIEIDQEQRLANITVLSQEQIKTLINNIENTYPKLGYQTREVRHYQLKLIFTLYYGCGLRRTEGARLTMDEVDFNRRELFIKQGKNYKDRIVPMSEGVYRDLQDYIYNFRSHLKLEHNRLFIRTSGNLLRNLYHLQKVSEILPDKTITLHSLRHSIATHLLQNGMEIENIRLFLGHSSLGTTQLYTHIAL